MRLILLSTVISLMAFSAVASPVTYNQFLFISPVFQFGSSTDVQVGPTLVDGYLFNGEFCDNSGCSTGPVPTTADSLLRLTNLSLTCDQGSTCSPIDVSFEAQGANAATGTTSVNLNLLGIGSASGFARVCIADEGHLCSSDAQGAQSFSFPFFGTLTGNAGGSFFSMGFFDVVGDFHLDGLDPGANVSLPDSLDISLKAVSSQAPEPSSLLLLAAGLGLVTLLRRRSR
jgi:PEP-CTERM motif-containing protein